MIVQCHVMHVPVFSLLPGPKSTRQIRVIGSTKLSCTTDSGHFGIVLVPKEFSNHSKNIKMVFFMKSCFQARRKGHRGIRGYPRDQIVKMGTGPRICQVLLGFV